MANFDQLPLSCLPAIKVDTDILDTGAMEDSAEDMAVAISSSTISSATTTTTDLPATEVIHSADKLGKNNE